MKTIGFFKTHTAEEALAWVKPMTEAEKVACIRYLKAGTVEKSYRGVARCRVCRTMLGSTDNLTPNGNWRYPGKWEHYIEEHDVRPPDEEFIRDALTWALKQGIVIQMNLTEYRPRRLENLGITDLESHITGWAYIVVPGHDGRECPPLSVERRNNSIRCYMETHPVSKDPK